MRLGGVAEQGYTISHGKSQIREDLTDPTKIVIPSGSELANVIGEMAGVLPLTK